MKELIDKYSITIDGSFFIKGSLFTEDDFPEDMVSMSGLEEKDFYSLEEFERIMKINTLSNALETLCIVCGINFPEGLSVSNYNKEWYIKLDCTFATIEMAKVFSISYPDIKNYFFNSEGFWVSHKYLRSITDLTKKSLQRAEKSNNKGSHTYLMIDEYSTFIKIGKSISPSERERTLGAQIPKIKLLFSIDKDIERELHATFQNKRVRGEWFRLSMDEVLDIANKYGFKPIKR